jgi:hypothetical protein
MKKKEFITSDVWLSAALSILLKSAPDFKVSDGKTFFVFPASDATYRAIADFNNGTPLNAFLYSETVKKLRVEMFQRRGAAANGQKEK